jgi:enediyne biosynthesis protein CalE5
MSVPNPKQYIDSQRQGWDSVAEGWQKWWKIIEVGADDVSTRLVELAELEPGSRVLDIATGIGEPAVTVARKVSSSGYVLATDISSQMLSIAKQRAISLGLENVIEFKEGDAETISLPTSAFDAVLCRWGLMLLSDFRTGLSNIYGSLADGGRLVFAVWSSAEKVPFISMVIDTVSKETHKPWPPRGVPGPFALADENILKDSLIKSGFGDIVIEKMNVTFTFDSAEAFTSYQWDTAAPLRAELENEAQEKREEILKAVNESARKYADNNTGEVKITNEAICVVGKKK